MRVSYFLQDLEAITPMEFPSGNSNFRSVELSGKRGNLTLLISDDNLPQLRQLIEALEAAEKALAK